MKAKISLHFHSPFARIPIIISLPKLNKLNYPTYKLKYQMNVEIVDRLIEKDPSLEHTLA